MNKGIRISIIAIFLILGVSALFLFFFFGPGRKAASPTSTSTENGGGFFNFLKKDKPVTTEPEPINQNNTTETTGTIKKDEVLARVTSKQVLAFMPTSNGEVHFIEKGTGKIFSVLNKEETTISSRAIQKVDKVENKIEFVGEAEFNKNATALLIDIHDNLGNATHKVASLEEVEKSATSSFTGDVSFFEAGNGYSFVFNPSGDQIAQLVKKGNKTALEIFSLASPSKKTTLFSSTFGDWRLAWPEKNTLTLLSKPSGLIPGNLYFINKNNKTVSRGIGNILGLNTLISPDAKKTLYSASNNGGTFSTYIIEASTGKSLISPLRALADKCVWSKKEIKKVYCAPTKDVPKGIYPDDWYKGKVSLIDAFYTLDTESSDFKFILDPSDVGQSDIDTTHLTLNEKEDTLYFIDKNTSSLWSLRLD